MAKPNEVVEKYSQIADRIIAEDLSGADRTDLIIMISTADDKFQLRLDDMLNAPDETFRHEIADMHSFYDFGHCAFGDDRFVSRFASEEVQKENEVIWVGMKRKKARELVKILKKHGENMEYLARQMNWDSRRTQEYVKDVKYFAALLDLKIEVFS